MDGWTVEDWEERGRLGTGYFSDRDSWRRMLMGIFRLDGREG